MGAASPPAAEGEAGREEDISTQVARAVEAVLGRAVPSDAVLMAAGLDSLGAEELLAELSKLGQIDAPGAPAACQPLPAR